MFSSGLDNGVRNTRNYRTIDPRCAQIRLSSSAIDVDSFTQLLRCLNSNGAIQPLEDLVKQLSREEIQTLLDFNNQYILTHSRRLYELEKTYDALKVKMSDNGKSELDRMISDFGMLLDNPDFLAGALSLLKKGYEKPQHHMLVLKALEILSEKVKADNFDTGLRAGLALGTSPAFQSVLSHFSGSSTKSPREVADAFLTYLRNVDQPGHHPAGREILVSLAKGEFFIPFDSVAGVTEEELKFGISKVASVFRVGLANDGKLLSDLSSHFFYMNHPIQCLKGTQSVSDPILFIMGELDRVGNSGDLSTDWKEARDFFQRRNSLGLTAMNPFCDYPRELGIYYPAFLDLSSTQAVVPMVDLIHSFYRYHPPSSDERPLAKVLINILSEPVFRDLIPVMSEVHERGAWEDLFLILNLPKVEDRPSFQSSLNFMLQARTELQGKSIYDVLTQSMSETTSDQLGGWISSIGNFLIPGRPGYSENPILNPLFTTLRRVFYFNDAHPFVDILYDLTHKAVENERFFNLFFSISDRKEFLETLKLFSEMSKDGRMRDLLDIFAKLFNGFSKQGEHLIRETNVPSFDPASLRRHELDESMLQLFPIDRLPILDHCSDVNLTFPMDDYGRAGFDKQISSFLGCLNSSGQQQQIVDAMEFLRNNKTEKGQSYFNFQIDLFKAFNPDQVQALFVGNKFTQTYDDGRLFRLTDALPFWISHPMRDSSGSGPVLRPLFDLATPIIRDARTQLRRLQDYGAKVLRRSDFTQQLKYADHLLDVSAMPEIGVSFENFDKDRIARWVRNKECDRNTSQNYVENRVQEIVDDYTNQITNWELVNGVPRRSWSLSDFKQQVEPLFNKIGDLNQSIDTKSVLEGLLAFQRYYTLAPGQPPNQNQLHTPDYLLKWLHDRSTDPRPISYIYPGETKPRVRIVNGLDRFELVLINSDVETPVIGTNFGLKFLAQIGEAWGDEPRNLWPPEIQAKFPEGSGRPQTLAEAIKDIYEASGTLEALVGFPDLAECTQEANPYDPEALRKYETENPRYSGIGPGFIVSQFQPQIYNIHQLLSVLVENLPGSGNRYDGGMKFYRNFFFQMYYSTPYWHRLDTAGEKNNLSVVTRIARLGITHQASRILRKFDVNDPALRAFFKVFTHASNTTELKAVASELFVKDSKRQLIWKFFERLFPILEEPSERHPAAREKYSLDLAYLKQMALYLLSSFGTIHPTNPLYVVQPFLGNLSVTLHDHRDYFIARSDRFQKVLTSHRISEFLRALGEDTQNQSKALLADLLRDALGDQKRLSDLVSVLRAADMDPHTAQSLDLFSQRIDTLHTLAEYRALNMDELTRQILDFIEEQSSEAGANETAQRLRFYLAERLESGDLDQLLLLAKSNPNDFYRVLEALSLSVSRGDLQDFIGVVRRGLSVAGH